MRALLLAVLLAGCDPNACIRQSDCDDGKHCTVDLVCVDDAPYVDAGTDGATPTADLRPASPTPCLTALECEIRTLPVQRDGCEKALSPTEVAGVRAELACVFGACPRDCAQHQSDTSLVDPFACWTCARGMIGAACVERCR